MPTAVVTNYVRRTSVTTTPGGGETSLLNTGVSGTDFHGSLVFAANSLSNGDVIRIFAWGTFLNSTANVGNEQLRVYLNPGAAFASPIADSGTMAIPAATNTPLPCYLLVQITIRTKGSGGEGWCDTFLAGFQNPNIAGALSLTYLFGGGEFEIDTTQANTVDISSLNNE